MTDAEHGSDRTVVHLVRHGEVHNPDKILYGRLPDFHLSTTGHAMAKRVAEYFRGADVTHLRCSPMERTQETMAPIAEVLDIPVVIDGRVIEAENYLEGRQVSIASALRSPQVWWQLRNPLRPSWGEAYPAVVARMRLAMKDAAEQAAGHEAIIVTHQLPVWMARRDAEGRRLVHDPRLRECALASVTSFTYLDGRITSISYTEPAADLLLTQVTDDVPGA